MIACDGLQQKNLLTPGEDIDLLPHILTSLFGILSHDSPGNEPSHGTHWQATLVVEGGFGHGLQHPYLQCLGRHSPLYEHRRSKCSTLGTAKVKEQRRGDKHQRHNAGLKKSGGLKNYILCVQKQVPPSLNIL